MGSGVFKHNGRVGLFMGPALLLFVANSEPAVLAIAVVRTLPRS